MNATLPLLAVTRICCDCGAEYRVRILGSPRAPLDHRVNCEPCRRRRAPFAAVAVAISDVEHAAWVEAQAIAAERRQSEHRAYMKRRYAARRAAAQ